MLKTKSGQLVEGGHVERIIRRGGLKSVTGYAPSTIYELIALGEFPKPVKLGRRAVGWLEFEIADWQRRQIEARDAA